MAKKGPQVGASLHDPWLFWGITWCIQMYPTHKDLVKKTWFFRTDFPANHLIPSCWSSTAPFYPKSTNPPFYHGFYHGFYYGFWVFKQREEKSWAFPGDLKPSRYGAEAWPCRHVGSAWLVPRGRRVSWEMKGWRAEGVMELGELWTCGSMMLSIGWAIFDAPWF